MENNWHDIPGYEGLYQFNWHTNQVKSLKRVVRMNGGSFTIKEKLLKVSILKRSGHPKVTLWKEGRGETLQLGRITLLITKGPKPEGMVCCHNDSNPKNNYPDNLRYDSVKGNIKDAVKIGTLNSKKRLKVKCSNGIIFNSITEATVYLGNPRSHTSNISKACRGGLKIAYGYGWEYIS